MLANDRGERRSAQTDRSQLALVRSYYHHCYYYYYYCYYNYYIENYYCKRGTDDLPFVSIALCYDWYMVSANLLIYLLFDWFGGIELFDSCKPFDWLEPCVSVTSG